MKAKELFERVLSQREVQFVVNCDFQLAEIDEEDCAKAFSELSRTEKYLVKSRINRMARHASATQLSVLNRVKKVIS